MKNEAEEIDVLTLDYSDNFELKVYVGAYNSNNGHKQSAEPGRESKSSPLRQLKKKYVPK